MNLGYLYVSKPRFSREIPRSLGSRVSLESLHLEQTFCKILISPTTTRLARFLSSWETLSCWRVSICLLKTLKAYSRSVSEYKCSFCSRKQEALQWNMTTKSKSSTTFLIAGIICGFLGVISITTFLLSYCFRKPKDNNLDHLFLTSHI